MMSETNRVVKVAPNNPVFDLPVMVGIEEGLFAKAGLAVSFSASYEARENDSADKPILSRLKEQLFECDQADSYNVCEWGSIDRLERGQRDGHIAALRAAVAAQAILTFEDELQTPRDMAGVPVVVQELTGSHYTTLQMLESAVGREQVKIENGGLPRRRWEGLKNGTYRAVAVMEPFISLGLKEGAHIIAASFYRGGEVVAAELTPEQRKAYYDAENEAVDLINADFYKYAHHVTAATQGALMPHELLRAFVHYKHVDAYDPALFNRAYDWMKARGMTEGQSQHRALVAELIADETDV
jgi:NitT/TauT family transport system substrate-binding protein